MKIKCDRCRMWPCDGFGEGDMCHCGGTFREEVTANFNIDTLNKMIGQFPPIPRALEMITSPYLVISRQVRFPQSKRVRIRRKWAKRSCNHETSPDPHFYRMGDGKCVCHPEMLVRLKRAMKAQEETEK